MKYFFSDGSGFEGTRDEVMSVFRDSGLWEDKRLKVGSEGVKGCPGWGWGCSVFRAREQAAWERSRVSPLFGVDSIRLTVLLPEWSADARGDYVTWGIEHAGAVTSEFVCVGRDMFQSRDILFMSNRGWKECVVDSSGRPRDFLSEYLRSRGVREAFMEALGRALGRPLGVNHGVYVGLPIIHRDNVEGSVVGLRKRCGGVGFRDYWVEVFGEEGVYPYSVINDGGILAGGYFGEEACGVALFFKVLTYFPFTQAAADAAE